MAEVKKQNNTKRSGRLRWLVTGICLSMAAAALFTSLYGYFADSARRNNYSPLEDGNNLTYLYQNCYVLYRDLYNKQNNTNIDYDQLYAPLSENLEGIDIDQLTAAMDQGGLVLSDDEDPRGSDGGAVIGETIDNEELNEIIGALLYIDEHFKELEADFSRLNATYDYKIEDLNTGESISNLTDENISLADQAFFISIIFDEFGNASLERDVKGVDTTKLRKNVNEVIRNCDLQELVKNQMGNGETSSYLSLQMPRSCRVTFCISNSDWTRMQEEGIIAAIEAGVTGNYYYTVVMSPYDSYCHTSCIPLYLLFGGIVFLLGMFLPDVISRDALQNKKYFSAIPLEVFLFALYLIVWLSSTVVYLVYWTAGGKGAAGFQSYMAYPAAVLLAYIINLATLTLLFFAFWYLGVGMRSLRGMGIREIIRKRSLTYRIFPYIKKKGQEIYADVEHFDVTKNARRLILKIVLVNAVILFIISCLGMGSFALTVLYSVGLYFVLKRYISGLQKKYSLLLSATNKIAEGDLNVAITEDLGVFEPFKPQVIRIQKGFQKAVEEETRSQRMKAELITNVSHDLKTPLTAIITYIGLLKDENITEEQRKEYLDTLERKSLRLKVLIEDLFEVSKANSQTMTLNIMDVDLGNLLKQVVFELSDKFEAAGLEVRMQMPEEKVVLPLDSQKTYRIYENLFGNIAKYALPGTRVYVELCRREGQVWVTLKNITANEITVNPEELTERFVRGDVSRNTEGSGLGLAIVRSFMEIQGGKLSLEVDGDLFKATTVFSKMGGVLSR